MSRLLRLRNQRMKVWETFAKDGNQNIRNAVHELSNLLNGHGTAPLAQTLTLANLLSEGRTDIIAAITTCVELVRSDLEIKALEKSLFEGSKNGNDS